MAMALYLKKDRLEEDLHSFERGITIPSFMALPATRIKNPEISPDQRFLARPFRLLSVALVMAPDVAP